MKHIYIKPVTSRLNGKVESSHRTDKQEFYQLLDVEWESFYNFHCPHSSYAGKTPYEMLKTKMGI